MSGKEDCESRKDTTMAKTVVAIIILVVLLMFNPGIDAHREAVLPCVEKSMNEAYRKGNWLSKIGFLVAGDDIKATILGSLRRKNYGVFSLGYIEGELASFGILGYVYVFE